MFLIEVTAPRGALTEADRGTLAEEIISGLISAGDGSAEVPEATMRRARRMTHLGFHALTDWHTGDGLWRPPAAPPLWFRITVPEAWRTELSRHLMGWIRRVVHRLDRRRGWTREPSSLWVTLTGVAEGSIGLGGRPGGADDVLDHLTEEFRAGTDPAREVPEGSVIDPMCGMVVRLGPGAITVQHDGETLGFCAAACRDGYLRRHLAAR